MEVWIYGASDDLIEISGDIREEFTAPLLNDTELAINPIGATITVEYDDDGVWRLAADGDYDSIDWYDLGEHEYRSYSEALRIEADDIEVRQQ